MGNDAQFKMWKQRAEAAEARIQDLEKQLAEAKAALPKKLPPEPMSDLVQVSPGKWRYRNETDQ